MRLPPMAKRRTLVGGLLMFLPGRVVYSATLLSVTEQSGLNWSEVRILVTMQLHHNQISISI